MDKQQSERLLTHDITANNESFSPSPNQDEYVKTIESWKDKCNKLAFVYDYVIDKYKRRVDRFALISFLITSIITLISVSTLGLSEITHPLLSTIIKVSAATLSTISTITTGVAKLFGWSVSISAWQKYLDLIENFTARIAAEDSPDFDAKKFVIQRKSQFLSVLSSAPDIYHHDYIEALNDYEENSKKFRQDLMII